MASRNQPGTDVTTTTVSGNVNQPTISVQQPMSTQQQETSAERRATNLKLYEEQNKLLEPDFARANKLMKRSGVVKRIFGVLLVGYGTLRACWEILFGFCALLLRAELSSIHLSQFAKEYRV